MRSLDDDVEDRVFTTLIGYGCFFSHMILETIILLYRICSQFILGNVALEGTANIFHGFFLGNAVLEGNAATTVRVRYLVSLPLGLRLGLSLFELGYDIRRSFGASQTHHQGMMGRHTTRHGDDEFIRIRVDQ